MLIPIGFFGGGGAAGSYELIETVSGSGTSISFTSIPQSYKHLQVRANVRFNSATSLKMRMNGVTTSSYAWHALRGNGSTGQAQGSTGQDNIQVGEGLTTATSAYSPHIFDVLDYTSSKNKTVRVLYGSPASGDYWVGLTSGLLLSTNAITSLTFFSSVANFSGARFSLYGIKG